MFHLYAATIIFCLCMIACALPVSVLIFCVSIDRDTYVKEMSGETKNDRNDRGLFFVSALDLLFINYKLSS